ncbi:hypothetical protein POTOM_017261 [Populus tomentosa]|uniref:Uncharacterized protein n=1 Tax=Populus tomentosa TaxID=118781 RepID=A0A8X8D4F9_POPTO|nr:hypothetical protein POTOM_017261 [Populus tomentosa]
MADNMGLSCGGAQGGHLGQLALSGVALATSINNVTGFSLLVTFAVTSRRKKTQNSFTCREVMEEEGKREERKWAITWEGFVQELKKERYIAAPMVAVSVLQYLLQVVSVIIVGHLGALALSSAAIATSITNVTGFSLLVCLLILSLF